MVNLNRYRPTALEQVVSALVDLKNNNGSMIKHIVQHVRTTHKEPTPIPVERRIELRVKRGLREGVVNGLLVHNAGRYKLADSERFNLFSNFGVGFRTKSNHLRQCKGYIAYKRGHGGNGGRGGGRTVSKRRKRRQSARSGRQSIRSNKRRRRRRRRYSDTSATSEYDYTGGSETGTSGPESNKGGETRKSNERRGKTKRETEQRQHKPERKERERKEKRDEDKPEPDKKKTTQQSGGVQTSDIDNSISRDGREGRDGRERGPVDKKPKKSKSKIRIPSDPREESNVVPPKKSLGRLTLNQSSINTNIRDRGRSRGRSRGKSRPKSRAKSRPKSKPKPEQDPSDDDEQFTGEPMDTCEGKTDHHPSYLN